MKVLMLNGSPKANGNTNRALTEIGEQLKKEGIDYEIFQIGSKPLRDCIACGKCNEKGCVFTDDIVNDFIARAKEADGYVFGSPVYYANPDGRILSVLNRAFYSAGGSFAFKPGAVISIARRGGTVASVDSLQKYFGINQMPVVSSTYWNQIYGAAPGEVEQDAEGMQTMRNLARNMAWMLKCFKAGKKAGVHLPETETGARSNFIR